MSPIFKLAIPVGIFVALLLSALPVILPILLR